MAAANTGACIVCGGSAAMIALTYSVGTVCLPCAREWKAEVKASEARYGAGKDQDKEKAMPKKKRAVNA